MAKDKEKPTSLKAYFEKVFMENKEWLEPGTNDAVIDRWKKDHPGHNLTGNIKASLSNAKSRIRTKLGMGSSRKRKRRKARGATAEGGAVRAPRARLANATLEKLEEQIDRCLYLARQQEGETFENVTKHLRAARNGVVWILGESDRAHV